MRTDYPNGGWSSGWSFANNGTVNEIRNSVPATVEKVFYHQFRVPYSNGTAQGQYTGQVTFRVVTL